ncbi:hypothetical protein J7T55_009067 [Diaporthe amygdali]|uniref:uncharacterized protein n=1 Tax=Phomopsis amygdali TaxID=1214568 RepID=UPI0022FDB308|nr:uncharacterized protein J7T55_009067 [Diaporthe amygdali]KAJ0118284.1 hypothetical protein J7T55_009067 [Diaporthe amygdali]
MVYCGKPSKGCSNCRERKIRCDQREPGCGQCEKRQQQCPGYRNLVDLMFRDESSHVIKKATAKARKKKTQSPDKTTPSPTRPVPTPKTLTWSPPESSSSSSPRRLPVTPLISTSTAHKREVSVVSQLQWSPVFKFDETDRQLVKEEPELLSPVDLFPPSYYHFSPSYQERGVNLFITRYISVSENFCHHKYDFLFDLWTPGTSNEENDSVLASVTAVGLVGVAQMTRSQTALDAARKSYGKALQLTNAALRDQDEAVKDTTMLSVLILGLFEMIGGSSARTTEAWQKHLNGAAALARLRGMGQFRSRAGIRMFFMLTQNTMINCIQNELPMPKDLIDLRSQLGVMFNLKGREPGFEICNAMYNILQLRYDIKQNIVTDLDEMLDKFTEAEDDFERVVTLFPEDWQYRKYRLTQRLRPGFFNNVCHSYPSLRVSTIWNGLRTCRMLIIETMLEELRNRFLRVPVAQVPGRHQFEYQKAKFKLEKIALAILASVPQHFGLVPLDGSAQDTFAPMPTAEDVWPQIPDSSWGAELGEGGGSDPNGSDDGDDYCQSPSLNNAMQVKDVEASAKRFMLLSSVTNGLVWPLYLVGMSTASSAAMRAFVVERLHAIHDETGLAQAKELASVVESHKQSSESSGRRPRVCGSTNLVRWESQYAKENQRTRVLPV